jgi:hypothetical protein
MSRIICSESELMGTMQQYLQGFAMARYLDIVTNLRTISCCIILYTYSLSNTTSLSIVFESCTSSESSGRLQLCESVAFLSSGHSLVRMRIIGRFCAYIGSSDVVSLCSCYEATGDSFMEQVDVGTVGPVLY